MSDAKAISTRTGLAIAILLKLPRTKYGKISTTLGDKDSYGLALTITKLLADPVIVNSIIRSAK